MNRKTKIKKIYLACFATVCAACGGDVADSRNELLYGSWGGERIALVLNSQGGKLDYDCSHGTIDQKLQLDAEGNFSASGIHTFERGGGFTMLEEVKYLAQYSGKASGTSITLVVFIPQRNAEFGRFELTKDAKGSVMKCP